MNLNEQNTTLLFVDDEPGILESYKKILTAYNEGKNFSNVMERRSSRGNADKPYVKPKEFRILLAESGEQAIKIVKQELLQGRKIAAGFFDIVMGDGISGIQTIKEIKKLDTDILCAVVTAYSDISFREIDDLFESPSQWQYFKKPFTKGELVQCVLSFLDLWKLKFREKEYLKIIEEKNNTLTYQSKRFEDMVEKKTQSIIRQRELMHLQYQFTYDINCLKSLDEILHHIINFTKRMLLCDRISIMLEEDGFLKIKESIGVPKDIANTVKLSPGEGLSGRVFKNKEPMIINNIDELNLKKIIVEDSSAFISIPMISSPIGLPDNTIGVINITNKKDDKPFTKEDLILLTFISNASSIAISNHFNTVKLEQSYFDIINTINKVIEAKDPYTQGHSERVREYAHGIAKELGLHKDIINLLDQVSILHDIGKIGISGEILNKPGKLTDDEYNIIKEHPKKGFDMIKNLTHLKKGHQIVNHHHERIDGKGYPDGLKFDEIEFEARIIAVADSYDAMTSTRSYRNAMEPIKAIEELKRCSGTQFDKKCVDAFIKYFDSLGIK